MPLSALLWRGEDSGGNVLVCSTAPPYHPPRFHPNQHTLTRRSRSPPSGEGSETERGTSALPETFRLSEELGLPLNSGAFPGSQQAPCGSQAAAKRCLHAANGTCGAVSWQRPASSIHRRARPGALHRTHLGRTRLSYTRAKRRERRAALKAPISKKGARLHLWHGTTAIARQWSLAGANTPLSKRTEGL